MSKLLKQVSAFLDQNESAPSACCLVKTYHHDVIALSDFEMESIYERSEGENDSEREYMLTCLSPEMLADLAATCLEIAFEKIESFEKE